VLRACSIQVSHFAVSISRRRRRRMEGSAAGAAEGPEAEGGAGLSEPGVGGAPGAGFEEGAIWRSLFI